VFDSHNSAAGEGAEAQANLMVYSAPTGLELRIAGGPSIVNLPTDPGFYCVAIGPVTKCVWYDFMYHVKWSSGADSTRLIWCWRLRQLFSSWPLCEFGSRAAARTAGIVGAIPSVRSLSSS
jgi:hypothetical protein